MGQLFVELAKDDDLFSHFDLDSNQTHLKAKIHYMHPEDFILIDCLVEFDEMK